MAFITNKERARLTDRITAGLGKQKLFSLITVIVSLVWILWTIFSLICTVSIGLGSTMKELEDSAFGQFARIGNKANSDPDALGELSINTWIVFVGACVVALMLIALVITILCTRPPKAVVQDAIKLSQSARGGVSGPSAGVVVEKGTTTPTSDPTLAPGAKKSTIKPASRSKKK